MADHLMLLRAFLLGAVRWEAHATGGGELCFAGLRYSCEVDDDGFPILGNHVRSDLARHLFRELEKRAKEVGRG